VALLDEATTQYAIAPDGTLAYTPPDGGRSLLAWVTRDGKEELVNPDLSRDFTGVSIDPSGGRIAVGIKQGVQGSIWQYALGLKTMSRLTFDGYQVFRPLWTADGSRIAYSSDRTSKEGLRALWVQPADGTGEPELLVSSPRHVQELTWSADGRAIAYREGYSDGGTNRDIFVLRAGADTTRRPFVATAADEQNPKLSPDGRWLAYMSDQSGQREVYVQPFPSGAGRWQISTGGGTQPLWRRDGRELFYLGTDGNLFAVPILPGGGFAHGAPHVLFSAAPYLRDTNATTYDIMPDDSRFLFIRRSAEDEVITVVNWIDEVRRLFGKAP
jgi:Tol biopolymer transport system component